MHVLPVHISPDLGLSVLVIFVGSNDRRLYAQAATASAVMTLGLYILMYVHTIVEHAPKKRTHAIVREPLD